MRYGWITPDVARSVYSVATDEGGKVEVAELTPEHRSTWYSEYNIYRMTMFYSLIASVLFIALMVRLAPVVLLR